MTRPSLTLTLVLLIIVLTAVKLRISAPRITPDSERFLQVADNIRLHGCLSESDPRDGSCAPAWGSEPPGYPLFLVVVRVIGSKPQVAIAVQAFLFAGAAFWLASSLPSASATELLVRVVVLLASPLTLAWGRWLLTETLATAATMCVFAVFFVALRDKRVRLPILAAVLIVSLMLRWDQLTLIPPALLLLGLLYQRRKALRRAIVVAAVVAIPYAALSVRALLHGLPPTPPRPLDLDLPPNLLQFWRSTALDQRATSGLIWPTWTFNYLKVRELDLSSISSDVPRADLAELLDQLSQTDSGAVFPPALDEQFGRLATRAAAEHPVHSRIGVPLSRFVRIWAWPDRILYSGWEGVGGFLERGEVWRSVYRILLLLIAGVTLLGTFGRDLQRLSALVCLYVIGRTCFLIWPALTMLEPRLLVEAYPALELLALGVIGSIVGSLERKRFRWFSSAPTHS